MRVLSVKILLLLMLFVGTRAFCQTTTNATPPQPAVGTPIAAQPRAENGKQVDLRVTSGSQNKGGDGSGGQYTMSFDNADLQSVVKFLSLSSKIPIIVDPDMKGNITIISSKEMSLREVYEVINAALRARGYTMIGGLDAKVIRVVPAKKAIVDANGVVSGAAPNEAYTDQDIVTQVVVLNYASSDGLRDELKTLISSDEASLVSVSETNTLIITDHAGNVKKLLDIIKAVDVNTTGLIVVEVYQCLYSSADNLVATLNTLFQPKNAGGQNPGGQGNPGRGGQPGGQGQPGAPPPGSGNDLASLKGQITITSDSRTNRLVISGTKERINIVLDVIKRLDVDTEPEVKVKCFPLMYADAQMTADQLNNMFEQPQGSGKQQNRNPWDFWGGMPSSQGQPTSYAALKRNVVIADLRTNSLFITATDQNMKIFESIIKGFDTPKVLSELQKVYFLKYAKANDLADVLTKLLEGNDSNRNSRSGFFAYIFGGSSSNSNAGSPLEKLKQITIVPDPKTNSLLVTGPPNTIPLMDDLVAQLDKRTAQVFIEVAIVDVTLNKENQFGVEWTWQDSPNTPHASDASTSFDLDKLTTGLKYSILNNNVSALLKALQTRNDVKVLSTPCTTTADNVQAKISIGQDIPYVTNSSQNSVGNPNNTIGFQNVSISLTVTPHVNGASDVIGLDVHQLINEVVGTDPALNAPIIADREALTSVTVRDGQTMVIGGIIQESKTKITSGVPLLSSLPLIGNIFKSTDYKKAKTELMVFITPRILKTEEDAIEVTDKTKQRMSVAPPAGAASIAAPPSTTP